MSQCSVLFLEHASYHLNPVYAILLQIILDYPRACIDPQDGWDQTRHNGSAGSPRDLDLRLNFRSNLDCGINLGRETKWFHKQLLIY